MIVDAYCHVGLPRFGSAENAVTVAKRFGIDRQVLVLGPSVPDYESLFRAMSVYPDHIRGIGIPFGRGERRQIEIAEIQLRAGVSGLRLSGDEFLEHPTVPELIGLAGRWIYAVGIINNVEATEGMLNWLEAYPLSRIAAPHFLRPSTAEIEAPLADLIRHPRFYPIFSHHGGLGSREPYPHADFKPWIESVVVLAGCESILFGSEYLVIFWRNETVNSCLGWIQSSGIADDEENRTRFLGETAKRLFFDRPGPEREDVHIPDWVDEQFDLGRTIPLRDGFEIPMDTFPARLEGYIDRLKNEPDAGFIHKDR